MDDATGDRKNPVLTSAASEIERYLFTGESDMWCSAWHGDDFLARTRAGNAALRGALIEAVQKRSSRAMLPEALANTDVVTFTRIKVEPMVKGLFPAFEQEAVLGMLETSVVFLTPSNIVHVLSTTPYLSSAWSLANLYLLSVKAQPLSDEAPRIAGMSEDTTCFVSLDYFHEADPLADFVVHEAAHTFHNTKRVTIGLSAMRRRDWLLEIEFCKRETFAYACEAYSRLTTIGGNRRVRLALLAEHAEELILPDDRVDPAEYLAILHCAIGGSNGWKKILQACAPLRRKRARASLQLPLQVLP